MLLRRPDRRVAGWGRRDDARMGGGPTARIHPIRTRGRPMRQTESGMDQRDSTPVNKYLAEQNNQKHERIDKLAKAKLSPCS
uniref:Uncharacterized protein n=1 Tax=Thermogemmatispora argillosa TaxID=2045280 RepID=A0A455SZA7_9CHLR|nr:hypothetical protein KTA_12190 [Thermogemmatispora argillosa]